MYCIKLLVQLFHIARNWSRLLFLPPSREAPCRSMETAAEASYNSIPHSVNMEIYSSHFCEVKTLSSLSRWNIWRQGSRYCRRNLGVWVSIQYHVNKKSAREHYILAATSHCIILKGRHPFSLRNPLNLSSEILVWAKVGLTTRVATKREERTERCG